jgi:hypothetical protein
MTLLDLQGLEPDAGNGGGKGGGNGGSTLTLLLCGSTSPSNLSTAACH